LLFGSVMSVLFGSVMSADAQLISSDQWNGFYAGINTGAAGLGTSSSSNPTECFAALRGCGPSATGGSRDWSQSFKPSGLIGGVQAGYNWQIAPKWTVGIETDFGGSSARH